jgi:hypothetical protein
VWQLLPYRKTASLSSIVIASQREKPHAEYVKDLNTENPIRGGQLRYSNRPENADKVSKVVEFTGPIYIQPKGFDQFPGEPPDYTWRPPTNNASFPRRESKVDNAACWVIVTIVMAVCYAAMLFFFGVPLVLLPLIVLILVGLDLSDLKKEK